VRIESIATIVFNCDYVALRKTAVRLQAIETVGGRWAWERTNSMLV
jgi:hypothetical protein